MMVVPFLGVVFMLRNTALSASTRTQPFVILSTSETEYVVMAHQAKTALTTKVVSDCL